MSSQVDSTRGSLSHNRPQTWQSMIDCSLSGVVRGVIVHTLIHPADVTKIRLQCSENVENSVQVALRVFREEGLSAFYKGLAPQLLRTSLKQFWCWPVIIGGPSFFQGYGIGDLPRQALTGVCIATLDATIATPLERAKILAASTGKAIYSLRHVYKEGWQGYPVHWTKLCVNWAVFLTAQQYLRDKARIQPEQTLSFAESTKIGMKVALIVSVVSAPFDRANTLKQAKNLSPVSLFSRGNLFKLYRGWPLSALSLVVHNVASVTLIEKLSRQ